MSGSDTIGLCLVSFVTIEWGLLDPINQIVKYHNFKSKKFGRLKKVVGCIAIDVTKFEPANPHRELSVIVSFGIVLLFCAIFAFFVAPLVGIGLLCVFGIFIRGQQCRAFNAEYEGLISAKR
ncbi:hypothetical protein E2553_30695 [Paraburkholderia dipogonis]|uniref:Uncharacterized protein n=1 Tax=Paraburkholderia dipogonis TaxID=1211383 RepID=A0A4Y8MUK8_9BURK|nr:hypothetical protein [Paraburkholderia dipogonis]TFE41068.1 hypothetical protein E2553_30695 [Paraburkholderia dipogonis]